MTIKEKRVTLATIAKEAGVSVGTVAKVLSGAGGNAIRVGKDTGERIRRIAARRDYQPNHSARILVGKSSNIIGLLIDSQAPMSTFRILSFIEKRFSSIGYRVMIAEAHDDVQSFAESCRTLRQYGVEGIISLAHDYPGNEELLKKHFSMSEKIVFVGQPCFNTPYYVEIDHPYAINQAFDYLVNQGRKKFSMAYFNNGSYAVEQRKNAFIQAAAKHKVQALTLPIPIDDIDRNIENITNFTVKNKFDVIFAPDDFHAIALPAELGKHNLKVPEQISVIGNDNEPFARLVSPKLTTIDENAEGKAAAAVEMLFQILAGKTPAAKVISNSLIIRESA